MNSAVFSDKAPKAIGPYSQAVVAGNMLFVSGTLPIDPETNNVVEGCIKCHTKQVLNNMKATVEAAGFSMSDIVKTTVYMADISEFAKMNEVYASYFSEPFPARMAFEVAALPKPGAKVEIEAIAVKG